MRNVILVSIIVTVFCPSVWAQAGCAPAQCKSELLRVEIAQSAQAQSASLDSSSLMSEFGVANITPMQQLALLECAAMSAAGRPIPPRHACIGLPTTFDGPITTQSRPNPGFELMVLSRDILGRNVTSERIKQRLMAIREDFLNRQPRLLTGEETPEDLVRRRAWERADAQREIDQFITPMIEHISANQLTDQMPSILEIHNSVSSTGIALRGVCTQRSSPHENRSIPNCPVQVYADLNEFNNLLAEMWESGRLCTSGRGRFRPERENGERKYGEGVIPLGTGGCAIEAEGMKCYIKSPPRLSWDTATRKYNTSIALESCYHADSPGYGRLSADFNFNMSFSPSVCGNGDFCVTNPDVSWSVVTGTFRSDRINLGAFVGIDTNVLGDGMVSTLSNGFRLPLSSGAGPLAQLPLEADGRFDAGSGFFGACLRPRQDTVRAD